MLGIPNALDVLSNFAFLIVGSIVLIMASVIGLRVWWFNRKFGAHEEATSKGRRPGEPGVIEGEYRIVDDGRKDA